MSSILGNSQNNGVDTLAAADTLSPKGSTKNKDKPLQAEDSRVSAVATERIASKSKKAESASQDSPKRSDVLGKSKFPNFKNTPMVLKRPFVEIPQELRATVRKEELEGTSDWEKPSFQASFLPEDEFSPSLNLAASNAVQRNAMIYLGKYNGAEYQMCSPSIILKLSPEMVRNNMPTSMISALGKGWEKLPIDGFFTLFTNPPKHKDGSVNTVSHGWVHQGRPAGFNSGKASKEMGIFAGINMDTPSGGAYLPSDRLQACSVHAHDLKCSPNNARILPIKDTELSHGWVAVKNNGRVLITHLAILNSKEQEINISASVEESSTCQDLIENISRHSLNVAMLIDRLFLFEE